MLGLTACGSEESISHTDKAVDQNNNSVHKADFEKQTNQEKTAILLQEYHDYFEKGVEPIAHRTDFEKKMGIFKDSWIQRSRARAIEIALKNGVYVGSDSDTVTFTTHGHVPTDISVNGRRVAFFTGDYSDAEREILGIQNLNGNHESKVSAPGADTKGGSLSSKTVVSPEAGDFL